MYLLYRVCYEPETKEMSDMQLCSGHQVYYREGTPFLTPKAVLAAKKAERKFIAIPLVFIALRMWGTIRFFCFVHNCATGQQISTTADEWLAVLHVRHMLTVVSTTSQGIPAMSFTAKSDQCQISPAASPEI